MTYRRIITSIATATAMSGALLSFAPAATADDWQCRAKAVSTGITIEACLRADINIVYGEGLLFTNLHADSRYHLRYLEADIKSSSGGHDRITCGRTCPVSLPNRPGPPDHYEVTATEYWEFIYPQAGEDFFGSTPVRVAADY